jgi:hypothetical protein
MTKDPAGFVDGPNLYAYVRQNPWSKFDPEGLCEECLIGAQANRMMENSHPWRKSDTVGAVIFFGAAAAPVALVAGEAALATKTAATLIVAAQGAVTAYNTSPAVRGAVDGAVTGAVTYADTRDPQAAVTNAVLVGVSTYASTPKGGVPNPGGKTAKETVEVNQKNVTNPYGSKGKPDHQAKIDELEAKARSEAGPNETVLREKKIQGQDSNRRPDVQIVDEEGKARKVLEAERRPESKWNRDREAEYDKLNIEQETHKVGDEKK